ncbi:hypothetical protein D5086_021165 [Populus alba]|uniref:Uncharacterized protein n=1 Tax=Populus alba TaxID=43335 RepID=A0ACC4BBZ3_POPAL
MWRTSSRSIHAQEGSPEIQRQLNFGNRGINRVKAFRHLRKKTSSRSIHAQEGSPEIQRQLNFGNRGIEVGMPRKLTESKRFAVCGRKCDVEQVAEAYMLKRDHPKFKGN